MPSRGLPLSFHSPVTQITAKGRIPDPSRIERILLPKKQTPWSSSSGKTDTRKPRCEARENGEREWTAVSGGCALRVDRRLPAVSAYPPQKLNACR